MKAERANTSDLPAVDALLWEGRAYLARQGLDQWQDFPPLPSETRAHFDRGELYVVREDGAIAGTFVLVAREPCYDAIDGAWRQNGAYLAVHRVAVAPAFRRRGVASFLFQEAARIARAEGATSLRIDTHADNLPMRGALEKNQFVCCGAVTIATGERRVAYEKELV